MRADALAIAKDLSDKLLEEAQTTIMNLNSDVAEANKKADGAIDKADGAIKKAATLGSENIKLNDKLKIANRTISQAAKVSKALAKLNTVRQQLLEANAQAVSERVKVEAVANDIGRKDKLLVERKPELQKTETLFPEANTQAANAVNEAAKLGSDNIKLTDELKIANRQLAREEGSPLVAE
ncbi:hypothetical protein A4X13_0g6929 [Tilletia indica]|uniref:Uncharacterized protein n=1 Tax=Tilletia indica TaxID=43049 RepID=A0A8T8SP63_9BASI|nr:hypothetical protein A4X13_0g6929 [Tilletia indica]